MAGVWAEGSLWFKVPSTLRIEVTGEFLQWISAKDLILYIIGKLGAAGADYRAVEFDGPAIRRMTRGVAHGARQPLDGDGSEGGVHAGGRGAARLLAAAGFRRRSKMIGPDADAQYERVIYVDAVRIFASRRSPVPHAGGLRCSRSPRWARCRCTRRCSDPARMAGWRTWRWRRMVAGRMVHPRTRLMVIPASQQILPRGHAPGVSGGAGGRRGDDQPAGMRAMRRRPPGHPSGGRELRLLDQPQFPGPDGQQGFAVCTWRARRWWRRPPSRASLVHPDIIAREIEYA